MAKPRARGVRLSDGLGGILIAHARSALAKRPPQSDRGQHDDQYKRSAKGDRPNVRRGSQSRIVSESEDREWDKYALNQCSDNGGAEHQDKEEAAASMWIELATERKIDEEYGRDGKGNKRWNH